MTVGNTLAERGSRYGDFTDHALIVQELMGVLDRAPKWPLLTPVKRQALTVIMDKVARILNGDPDYRDNWRDIQGYAKLAEDRCAETDPRQTNMDLVCSLYDVKDANPYPNG